MAEPPVAPDDTPRWLPLIPLENGSHVGLDVVMERWADLLQGDAPDLARIAKDIDDVAGHLWLKDSLQSVAPDDTPQVECPDCGVMVKQVASATLALALWQHQHWVCKGRMSVQDETRASMMKHMEAPVAPDDTPTREEFNIFATEDELRAEVSRLRDELAARERIIEVYEKQLASAEDMARKRTRS